VEYTVDAAQLDAFERVGRAWIALVDRQGGTHHGYFLPSEGQSRALPSIATASANGKKEAHESAD
jgi:hypothetical protein